MAASEIEICNAALGIIGRTELLEGAEGATLDDAADGTDSVALEQARIWYPRTRDRALRRFPWPFATLRETLVALPEQKRSDWNYAYGLPTDSLRLIEIGVAGNRNPRPAERYPHRIEARRDGEDIVGKLLLCDEPNIEIRHTIRVRNVAAYDPDFEDALELQLAAHFARAIIKGLEGSRLADDLERRAEYKLRLAAALAHIEEHHEQEPDGEFLASRKG